MSTVEYDQYLTRKWRVRKAGIVGRKRSDKTKRKLFGVVASKQKPSKVSFTH